MTKTRQWVTVTAVVVLVILVGGYMLLVKSQKSKVADLQTQTQAQLGENQLLLTQIAQLQALQSQLPAEQQALAKFSTQIPDSAAEPTLLRQLSQSARGAGVDLSSIGPGAVTPVSASAAASQTLGAVSPTLTLLKLPLTLTITGSYANVESFFQTLEKLPRALLVDTFSITPAAVGATGSEISVTMSAGVFFTPISLPDTSVPQSQTLPGAAPSTAPTTGTPDVVSSPAPGSSPATDSTPAAAS